MTDSLKRHYADAREESFLIKENHKSRQETTLYNPELKKKLEERQRQYFGYAAIGKPSEGFAGPGGLFECHLKGPHHPLAYSLHSAHKMGLQRTVRVEPESVNSVLLDEQPEDNIDQW